MAKTSAQQISNQRATIRSACDGETFIFSNSGREDAIVAAVERFETVEPLRVVEWQLGCSLGGLHAEARADVDELHFAYEFPVHTVMAAHLERPIAQGRLLLRKHNGVSHAFRLIGVVMKPAMTGAGLSTD